MSESALLVELLRSLSSADLSVVRATLETADSQIATVAGTPHEALWSALVERGFARELPLDFDVPLPAHFRPKSFALTTEGREVLPQLLGQAMSHLE